MWRVAWLLAFGVCLGVGVEEEAMSPAEALQMAELLEGEEDSAEEALGLFEGAWERCGDLGDKGRIRALKGMARLRGQVNRRRPKKAGRYRVLGVVFRAVDWQRDRDGNAVMARYQVDSRVLRDVKEGFEKAVERMDRASGESLKFEGVFVTCTDPIRSFTNNWNGRFSFRPHNYEQTRAPSWREGEYQAVIAYVIGNDSDDNNVPMPNDPYDDPRAKGAHFRTYHWHPQDAIDNGGRGAQEVRFFYRQLRDLFVNWNSYPEEVLPVFRPGNRGAIRENDPCYEDPDVVDEVSLEEHLLTCHVTPRMWSAVKRVPLSGECVRTWATSLRVFAAPNRDNFRKTDFIKGEADPELDISGWRSLQAGSDFIDLRPRMNGRTHASIYAGVYLVARQETDVYLSFGGGEAIRVFFRGELIRESMWGAGQDHHLKRVHLEKGPNLFLMKVFREVGNARIQLRVTDMEGRPARNVMFSIRR